VLSPAIELRPIAQIAKSVQLRMLFLLLHILLGWSSSS